MLSGFSYHSRLTRVMNEAKENEASLLPGKNKETKLIELCAATSEVAVIYSLRNMGARVICSATVNIIETAAPNTGLVTVPPPKRALSSKEVVNETA